MTTKKELIEIAKVRGLKTRGLDKSEIEELLEMSTLPISAPAPTEKEITLTCVSCGWLGKVTVPIPINPTELNFDCPSCENDNIRIMF